MRKLVLFVSAAVLASCSGASDSPGSAGISGGETFLELVEDARIAMRDGDLAKAGRFYDEARALEPDNPGLWVDIARLRFRGGEHLIAIEAADRALELDPKYAPALLLRGQLVRDANGLAESLVWFEAATAFDPRNPDALAEYAGTLGDLGRYGDMLRVVRQLAEIDPSHPQAFYLQAVLAARADDPVLAGTLLARSGLSEQGVPSALMLDAIVNMQQGTFDTAAEKLETLAESQPGNVRVSELLARAMWLGGRDRDLVERFSARAQAPEASPYLAMLVGRSLERMGDRENALPFIQKALSPRDHERIVLEGSARGSGSMPAATAELRDFALNGNVDLARSLSDILLERAPYSGDFHSLAGDVASLEGNPQRALQMYDTSARVRRAWPLTRRMIQAFEDLGAGETGDALLSRYVAGDPQNTEALLLFAERSAAQEDWLRVAVLLDTAIALGAGNDLEVLSLRANAANELGQSEEAQRFAGLYRELSPGDFVSD